MEKLVHKSVNLDLVGVNGNAFAIMGAFKRQATRDGWTKEEIDLVLDEARSQDYNHLIAVIENHCDPKEE